MISLKRELSFLSLILICLILNLSANAQLIRIAVAANAANVTKSLKNAFEKHHPAKLEIIIGSSGKLTSQIENGAPYDLFLSADMNYPENIFKKGLSQSGAPKIYAYGKLVIWTLKDRPLLKSIQDINDITFKTIVIANPATAPYGEAAMQSMQKSGIYNGLKNKIVFGESISQVNQYLLTGAADIAFTAKSVVLDPTLKIKGKWLQISPSLYMPIAQGVIVLKSGSSAKQKMALAFYQFLFTKEAKAIFQTYGYDTHE